MFRPKRNGKASTEVRDPYSPDTVPIKRFCTKVILCGGVSVRRIMPDPIQSNTLESTRSVLAGKLSSLFVIVQPTRLILAVVKFVLCNRQE